MAHPTTNAKVFAFLMIFTQIVLAVMNGVFIRPYDQVNVASNSIVYRGFFQPLVTALVVVLGFGLIFSYNRKLLFSGLGFSFFIFAFVLQLYPLINAFWVKTQILGLEVRGVTTPQFNTDIYYPYYLSRTATSSFYQNHLVSAFKCALAVIIAFSCILGRAGQLQAWLTVFIGTIGFELNRIVCYKKFQTGVDSYGDPFGTMNIFVFGGFMGLAMALFLSIRQRKQNNSTALHRNYTANSFSVAYSLLGTVILTIGLPFLIYDWYKVSTPVTNQFLLYTPVLCVLLSVSGSTISCIALGMIFYGRPIVRHLVYGPIAGAIIGGASSYYTSNPVYAIVVGVTGGMLQTIFMTLKQYLVNSKGHVPIATISFSLFGIQGFVGSAFAVCWKEIIESNSDGLNYVANGQQSHKLILYGLICMGFGVAFGILAGLLILFVNNHDRHHHFVDRTYWRMQDSISQQTVVVEQGSQQYYEGQQIKNQHAYL